MIKLEHIIKHFTADDGTVIPACDDVNLHVKKGEIFGIIGFSGAGKSTLLKSINLLERPDFGTVYVEGKNLLMLAKKELRDELDKIGSIIQQVNLFENKTVFENISLPLRQKGVSKKELPAHVKELLNLVDMSGKENAYPAQLSDGQKQRIAIARAIAVRPTVLLLDEATGNLDPATTKSILSLLKKLHKTLDLTIVLVAHQMNVIKEICDHVAVMDKGRIVEQGEIYSIFANPQNEITKKFIKSTSNLSKVEDLIASGSKIVQLEPGQKIVRLTYLQKNISEPLIASLTAEFAVIPNIIFADVEIVQDAPIGGTVVIFSGNEKAVNAALQWLREKSVGVEILAEK